MNWLKKIFTKAGGDALVKMTKAVGDFAEGHLGKKELTLALEKIMFDRDELVHSEVVAELLAKERIMVAELGQGDTYTKRTRPMIIRRGFYFVCIDVIAHVLLEAFGHGVPINELEIWFMGSWAGLTGTYTIGRSAEKTGVQNILTRMATGSKGHKSLLED